MEETWRVKCGSTLQSPTSQQKPLNQLEISSANYLYTHGRQGLRPTLGNGRMLDPVSSLSIPISGTHDDEGSSFLALLSRPPPLLQRDLNDLLSSKPCSTSNKLALEGSNVPASVIGSQLPPSFSFTSDWILPENLSHQSAGHGVGLCPIIPPTAAASSSSGCHSTWQNGPLTANFSLQSSDLGGAAVNYLLSDNRRAQDICLQRHGAAPANVTKRNNMSVHVPQQVPLAAVSSISNESSTFTGSCPRVFCLGTSGDLLLSNTGLLGILCSCHCIHMSVSKFSEHSGLRNVNPGDAVHMDTGETIAQWRKHYFQKFRIRVPEDQSGWDWPEARSPTASLAKSAESIPRRVKNSDCNDYVGQPGCLVRLEQVLDGGLLQKKPQSCDFSETDVLDYKQCRNGHNSIEFLLNGSVTLPETKMHGVRADQVLECPTFKCSKVRKFGAKEPENNSQFVSAYMADVMNAGSLSSACPSLQNLNSILRNSVISKENDVKSGLILDKVGAFSSIELRLGQPCQQRQSLGNPGLSGTGSPICSSPLKPFPPVQMIHNAACCGVGVQPGQNYPCATGMPVSATSWEKDQLNHGNIANSCFMDVYRNEEPKGSMAKTPVLSTFNHISTPFKESFFGTATDKAVHISGQNEPQMLPFKSHAAKYDPILESPKGKNNIEKQCIVPEFHFIGTPDKGSSMRYVSGNFNSNEDSWSRKHNSMENLNDFTGILNGCSSYGLSEVRDKDLYLPQISSVPLHESDAKSYPNHPQKAPCESKDQIDCVFLRSPVGFGQVPISFPLYSSAPTPGSIPVLLKDESNGGRIDDNLRFLALKQVLELPKQRSAISSMGRNSEHGRFGDSANILLQHSVVQQLASGEPNHRPNLSSKPNASKAAQLIHFGHPVNIDNDLENVAPLTGSKSCRVFSRLAHGMPLMCKDFNMQCQLSHDSLHDKQPSTGSIRLGQPQNSIIHENHGKNCQPRVPYIQGNFSSAAHVYSGTKCELGDGCSPISLRGSDSVQKTNLAAPKFFKSHFVSEETATSSNQEVQLEGHQPDKISCCHYQWKDVASKVRKVFDKEMDQRGKELGQHVVNTDKGSDEAMHVEASLKEQEMSNISSGCSDPAVTMISVDINRMDSSTVVARNSDYVDNLEVDEGSSIDKCWSSDGALESDRSTDTSTLSKEGSKVGNYQSSRSLLDEVKLMDALTWKKGQNKVHNGPPFYEKSNLLQESVRDLKPGKRKREMELEDDKCKKSTSSLAKALTRKRDMQCLLDGRDEKDEQNAGSSELFKDSSRKKQRSSGTSNDSTRFQIPESSDIVEGKTMRFASFIKASLSWKEKLRSRKEKPVACGKYGVLSGCKTVSKPVKIVSLDRILKAAKRCTPPKLSKRRVTFVQELKLTRCCQSNSIYTRISNLTKEKKSGIDEQSAHDSFVLHKEKNDKSGASCVNLETDAQTKSRPKLKEVRERCIYELTSNGMDLSSEMDSHKIFKHMSQIEATKISENTTYKNCDFLASAQVDSKRCIQKQRGLSVTDTDSFCSVCGGSNMDDVNCLLECGQCLIKVHQACYGVSKVPKGRWYCRPCRTCATNIVCVLCGYGGGAMTQALRSRTIVKSLLKAWDVEMKYVPRNAKSSSKTFQDEISKLDSCSSVPDKSSYPALRPNMEPSTSAVCNADLGNGLYCLENSLCHADNLKVHNSITAGLLDPTVKQWIHVVCGLWTPDTRCPNVDTMSAFNVSGVSRYRTIAVCSVCNRPGGSCIQCRVVNCAVQFHPWCAHRKGLLQSEVEGVDGENVGFYGRCVHHALYQISESAGDASDILTSHRGEKEPSCARTEGYKGRKHDGFWHNVNCLTNGKNRILVPPEQLNAWIHINGQRSCTQGLSKMPTSKMEYDCRKEFARYKQEKGWKHLVVYKSGIHALGLYTSQFISRGEMVVEYVGEIIRQRVSDKREKEYQSGRRTQYKSACYFFRIDKEQVIDATRKGGIARFVNHSCLPNCIAEVISVRNEKKVVFFAQRDIYPGEEITYDYHFNHEDEGMKIPCFCHSKNCRRYLN